MDSGSLCYLALFVADRWRRNLRNSDVPWVRRVTSEEKRTCTWSGTEWCGRFIKSEIREMLFQRKVTITDKKLKKIFNPVTRYFDLMDSLKIYPIRGGGGLTPSSFSTWSWWRNLDTGCKDFSKTFIHVATMSYLDTHFIKTSVINAAGKERLKIRELVDTKFQGDTLKAGEGKNRENLRTFVCTIQTSVRLSDFKELLYIFVSFQQITFKLDILTILRHSFWPYAWSC